MKNSRVGRKSITNKSNLFDSPSSILGTSLHECKTGSDRLCCFMSHPKTLHSWQRHLLPAKTRILHSWTRHHLPAKTRKHYTHGHVTTCRRRLESITLMNTSPPAGEDSITLHSWTRHHLPAKGCIF